MKTRIIIPKTTLGRQLDEAAALKHEATELLKALEERAMGPSGDQPGGWRHDPLGWLGRRRP